MNLFKCVRFFLAATLLSVVPFLAATTSQAAQSVTLAWNPSSGPNLAGYRVHEGTFSGVYIRTIDVGNRTTATISNLTAGFTYYFVVSAYNTAGVESAPSNEVAFRATAGSSPGSPQSLSFVPGRDLIWRNSQTGEVAIWVMNGTNIVQAAVIGRANLDWQILGVGDFLGTGEAAILWSNTITGQLSVWTMNGTTAPDMATFFVGGAGITGSIQAIGDFHGNGATDLIIHDSSSGSTWMVTNQGLLNFSVSFLGTADTSWKIAGVADLGGTGTPQLIWQNTVTGQVSEWFFSNGSLVANPIINFTPARGWVIKGLADVNGHGRDDIVWQNSRTGAVSVWETDGTSVLSIYNPGGPGRPNRPWQLNGISYLNGGGAGQIIWRNTSDGSVWTWNVNGSSFNTVRLALTPVTQWVLQPNQPVNQ
jgi:fibronectin type III domain protein